MIDFEYYTNEYKGNVITDETAFNGVLNKATALVDSYILDTENLKYSAVETKYNDCICAVIETLSNISKSEFISSESVGNHSINYSSNSAEQKSTIRNLVMTYLRNTGLLYGGLSKH